MAHGSFAAVINCMDGRTQIPVIEYLKKKHGVDYIDMITEPGPNKILAENKDKTTIDSIKRRVDISVKKHGSKHIAIVGHHDCAGNPVDRVEQLTHILSAIITVKMWHTNIEVVGLWVDENWKVTEVAM